MVRRLLAQLLNRSNSFARVNQFAETAGKATRRFQLLDLSLQPRLAGSVASLPETVRSPSPFPCTNEGMRGYSVADRLVSDDAG